MGSDNFKKLSDIAHIVVLCSFIGLVSLLIAELAVEKASTMQWLVRYCPC